MEQGSTGTPVEIHRFKLSAFIDTGFNGGLNAGDGDEAGPLTSQCGKEHAKGVCSEEGGAGGAFISVGLCVCLKS